MFTLQASARSVGRTIRRGPRRVHHVRHAVERVVLEAQVRADVVVHVGEVAHDVILVARVALGLAPAVGGPLRRADQNALKKVREET